MQSSDQQHEQPPDLGWGATNPTTATPKPELFHIHIEGSIIKQRAYQRRQPAKGRAVAVRDPPSVAYCSVPAI
jgi:hypothetical protein